jgi:hypothetical protein
VTRAGAFRASVYRVGGAQARIGRRSAGIDAVLAQLGVREALLLTAWNPGGRRQPPGWNRIAEARLRAALRGRAWLPAESGLRDWREPMHLAVLAPGAARHLGRRFRQAALVRLRRADRAVLVWLARG